MQPVGQEPISDTLVKIYYSNQLHPWGRDSFSGVADGYLGYCARLGLRDGALPKECSWFPTLKEERSALLSGNGSLIHTG